MPAIKRQERKKEKKREDSAKQKTKNIACRLRKITAVDAIKTNWN